MKSIFILALIFVVSFARPSEEEEKTEYVGEYGIYTEGDMILEPGRQNGLIDTKYRWPENVVYYRFGPSFNESWIPVVLQAHRDYEEKTKKCLTFVERNEEKGFIEYTSVGEGCFSSVGYTGRLQEINYPEWCINQFGSVLHEILHALGFFHEQSRYDRDDYVFINETNVKDGKMHNFDKYDNNTVSGYGEKYDYTSVMHYGAHGFAIDKNYPTIVTLDPAYQDVIGQRKGLSTSDWNKLLSMYDCGFTLDD